MKKIFRYLSLILACLMVISCLAILSGCNSTEDVKIDETVADTSSNTSGDGTDEDTPADTELISESETETETTSTFREVHPEIAIMEKNSFCTFFLMLTRQVAIGSRKVTMICLPRLFLNAKERSWITLALKLLVRKQAISVST